MVLKTEQTEKLVTKFQIIVNWQTNYEIELEQIQIVINHKRKTADEDTKLSVRNNGKKIKACSGTVTKR
jgi:hypothetical protein